MFTQLLVTLEKNMTNVYCLTSITNTLRPCAHFNNCASGTQTSECGDGRCLLVVPIYKIPRFGIRVVSDLHRLRPLTIFN